MRTIRLVDICHDKDESLVGRLFLFTIQFCFYNPALFLYLSFYNFTMFFKIPVDLKQTIYSMFY